MVGVSIFVSSNVNDRTGILSNVDQGVSVCLIAIGIQSIWCVLLH